MEIIYFKPSELNTYEKNKQLFDDLPKTEYEALKTDIQTNGIKNPLIILPNKTIICGHQRQRAAIELHMETVPCRIARLNTDDEIEEFVITENLLRRHLTTEQRAPLETRWIELRMKKRGGDHTSADFKQNAQNEHFDVYGEAAKELGKSRATLVRSVQYTRLVKEHPELKGEKVTKVLRQAKKAKQLETIKTLTPPTGEYNLIVIDPPWPGTGAYDPDGFRGAGDYPTMTLEEIQAIKLPAAQDCVLWLWGIDYHLKETLAILEAWGFERKSTLVWVKDKMGIGHWLRNQHEYCFLATKGKPIFHGEDIPSILRAPRREHSEKPDDFYALAEKASPYPKKLDYFARKKRPGWETYGDEVK